MELFPVLHPGKCFQLEAAMAESFKWFPKLTSSSTFKKIGCASWILAENIGNEIWLEKESLSYWLLGKKKLKKFISDFQRGSECKNVCSFRVLPECIWFLHQDNSSAWFEIENIFLTSIQLQNTFLCRLQLKISALDCCELQSSLCFWSLKAFIFVEKTQMKKFPCCTIRTFYSPFRKFIQRGLQVPRV